MIYSEKMLHGIWSGVSGYEILKDSWSGGSTGSEKRSGDSRDGGGGIGSGLTGGFGATGEFSTTSG